MKRLVIPLLLLLLLLPLCACAPESTVLEPVRIQTAAFDPEEARALIESLQRPMAEISVRESVTQAEYAAYAEQCRRLYNGTSYADEPPIHVFFRGEEIGNPEIDPMALNPDQFYPTTFHQGIDVTTAQTEAVFYEEQYADLNYTRLRVTVGYTGSDPQLAGWSLDWILEQQEDGTWLFSGCDGQANFMNDVSVDPHYPEPEYQPERPFCPTYLPMKPSWQSATAP